VGVLIAACLVWLGLPPPSESDYRSQLAQSLGSGQGASLHQAVGQLAADTLAAARAPVVVQALRSQDPAQIAVAEQTARFWNGVVDAQINLRGQAEQNTQRAAPMNFSALDMLRRAEAGQAVPAEAYKVGQRWLVYSVAPVAGNDATVLGTVLLVVDLGRLLNAFYPMGLEAGELRLQQKFANGAPQTLYQSGTPDSRESFELDSGNANWQLYFTPGPVFATQVPWMSIVLMLLAALAALAGAWIALSRTHDRLQRQVDADARQLQQLIQELSGGKAVKAFGLSHASLNGLAQSLARFSLRDSAGARSPAYDAAPPDVSPSGSVAAEPAQSDPTDWTDPLFQDTDILDIDLLDDDPKSLRSEHHHDMTSPASAPEITDSIFRAYDIRGIYKETLFPKTAYWIGRAIGAQSIAQGERNVNVGRDGRLSGPDLVKELIKGLVEAGCHVTDVGLVPTPALYYAANVQAGKSGVMLTGSHNPSNYNGFKIVIAGDTLANEQIQALLTRIKNNDLPEGEGSVTEVDILQKYAEQIKGDIAMPRRLKVVVDCGNGAAGVIAPQLIEALGCEVIPLFCDVDGNFPNHHPDPGKPENLVDLIAKVKETNADVGLAFDGDGDRVGVVTNKGTNVYADRLLMLFAQDVLSRNPGADIIFDVKCTRRLTPLIKEYGGRPVMWKTGHSLIKKKMKLDGALLAGEMSGHIFFKERWFGFDDGIYSAARLLEILSQQADSAEDVFARFPNDVSTPEINIDVTDESKFTIIDALQSDAEWGEASLSTIDGVRVDYPKGWGLVRASNTTPVLVLRFEADDQAELERIQAVFSEQLHSVAPDLKLPF